MADEAARREGMTKITELTAKAHALIDEAQQVAQNTGNSFSFSLGDRSLTFVPEPQRSPEFESSNCYEEPTGWTSSSDYC